MDKYPEQFNMADIMAKVEERTPYVIVAFQECEGVANEHIDERNETFPERIGPW